MLNIPIDPNSNANWFVARCIYLATQLGPEGIEEYLLEEYASCGIDRSELDKIVNGEVWRHVTFDIPIQEDEERVATKYYNSRGMINWRSSHEGL